MDEQPNQQLDERLARLETRINAIFISVEKTRKYFLWTMIITVAVIVLPLIGMAFVIPKVISSYATMFSGL